MRIVRLKDLMILSVFALAACGGGGGGGSSSSSAPPASPPPPPPAAQYPLDSAFSALEQMNQTYNLSATNSGNNYTLQLSFVPGSQFTWGSQTALTNQETMTESENGTLVTNLVATNYFTISPFTLLGSDDKSNGQVVVYANQTALPQLATVGQSGAFNTSTIYTDNTETTVYATDTETWSLNADTSTTALACMNQTINLSAGGTETQSSCYQVDERGDVLSLQITITENGVTLNFQ